MKKKPFVLSKASADVLDDLCTWAMSYGWERDQGTGKEVEKAAKHYNEARTAVAKRLKYLEQQNKRLRIQVIEYENREEERRTESLETD